MDVSRNTIGIICMIGGVAITAGAALAGSQNAPGFPGADTPLVVAQGKLDLTEPAPDFVRKGRDAASTEPEDARPEAKAPPSGISLSVTGSVEGQVTTSSGHRASGTERSR